VSTPADEPDAERLKALDDRLKSISAAQQAASAPDPIGEKYGKVNTAWRMVVELVVGMTLGMGIGYGLDRLFGTIPIFLMVFSLLGFAAGVRVMMRTAQDVQRQHADKD
jgi:ATP synthase protein I